MKPKLAEWHIYGNEQQGRFVTRKPESTLYYLDNISNDVLANNFFRTMDKKQYERAPEVPKAIWDNLKDHLGNVRATIGDYKMPFNDATSTRGVAPFFVDEKATNDYYPYGMLISDRSFNSGSSRYGYNGKENDNEVKGVTGSQIDYGFRIYSPLIAKFLSVDPLTKSFPWYSPYQFAGNTPIQAIDLDGKEPAFIILELAKLSYKLKEDLRNKIKEQLTVQRLGEEEQKVVLDNPWGSSLIYVCNHREIAESFALKSGLYGYEDGPADALRHGLFNALNTQVVGEKLAKQLGDAHEENRTPKNEAKKMDLFNNKVGIQVAKDNPNATPKELAKILLGKIEKGEMLMLNREGKAVPTNLTKDEKSNAESTINEMYEDASQYEVE